jgi:hypothetical protein
MDIDIIVEYGSMFATFALVTVFMLVFPDRIVQWQGRLARWWYKSYLQMPDDAVDKLLQLPTDAYTMGKRSQFLSRAPEHPEEYPRLIFGVRLVGCLIGGIGLLALGLLIWGALTGRLMIVR